MIRSPYIIFKKQNKNPDLSNGVSELIRLVTELHQIKQNVINELNNKLQEVKTVFEHIKTIQKGDKGDSAIPELKQQIIKEVLSSMPKIRDGRDAEIDYEKVSELALKKIPKVRGGKDAVVDYEYLLSRVSKMLDSNRISFDPLQIIDAIMNLPDGKFKLKTKHIDGLEQTIMSMRDQLSRGYLHGGGVPSLTAGSGITFTSKSDGGYIVSSQVSSAILTATGTIDDLNTSFTFTSQPSVLCINGVLYQTTGGAITWSWSDPTATLSVPVGTNGSIFGIK